MVLGKLDRYVQKNETRPSSSSLIDSQTDKEVPYPFSLEWCWERHSEQSGLSPPSNQNKPSSYTRVSKGHSGKSELLPMSGSNKVVLIYPPRLQPCQRKLTKTKGLNKIQKLIPQISRAHQKSIYYTKNQDNLNLNEKRKS